MTTVRVPLVDLARDHAELGPEIERAMLAVLRSGRYVHGEPVTAFEEAFASYCGVEHCVTVSSGTAALHLALLSLKIGAGDEVVTVSSSFIATAEAIAHTGATPTFADVDEATGNMDAASLEATITPRTRAILVVHLYGQPASMGDILSVAERHGLPVLEDAAQAHGARWQGRRAGALGTAGCFSFYPTKNLGASGEGGAFVTDDDDLAGRVRQLRDHGQESKYIHRVVGFNYRLDALQAAILSVRLETLDDRNRRRRALAERYRAALQGLPLEVPPDVHDTEPVFHLFVLRVDDRQRIETGLRSRGIDCAIHYPVPIHLQPAFAALGHRDGALPRTERRAGRILSVPMFPQLTDPEQDLVIEALHELCAS